MIGGDRLQGLFQILGAIMDAECTPELRIVVSGGAALIAKGLVHRSTLDVDVFAQREFEGDLIPGNPLPDWFNSIVSRVAKRERLPANWINADTSLVVNGLDLLPPETLQNLEIHCFGERLQVSFVGREAQIFLKLAAYFGRDEERDRIDLHGLEPTLGELEQGFRWLIEYGFASTKEIERSREDLVGISNG